MKTQLVPYEISKLVRERQNIVLDPSFQRGKVWPDSQKQLFIDSILKNWGVPKVYFALVSTSDNTTTRICVDGKQRISAIYEFIDGDFRLDQKISGFGAKKYSELPEHVRDLFNEYKIDVEEVSDFTTNDLSTLFQRLQLGVRLNIGENLNSIDSQMKTFCQKLIKTSFFTKKIVVLDTRQAHLTLACQMSAIELLGMTSVKSKNLKDFLKTYRVFNTRSSEAKKIKNVLSYLTNVFKNDKSVHLKSKGSIVSVYLLISELMKRGNLKGKGKELNRFVHKFYKDLKKEAPNEKSEKPEYAKYQTALLQSPDSLQSIQIRHEILLNKLANHNTFFKSLINTTTDVEVFQKLYDYFENELGSIAKVEDFLKKVSPKVKGSECDGNWGKFETFPTHVRSHLHHSKHPKFTKTQLDYSIKVLKSHRSRV